MTNTQRDLFKKFCSPGSDPIEAWVLRLSRTGLSTTAKAIGYYLGWLAHLHGNPIDLRKISIWQGVGLNPKGRPDRDRMNRALDQLENQGFLRRICVPNPNAGPDKAENIVMQIELLVSGGGS